MAGIRIRPLEKLSAILVCDGSNCDRSFHWVAPGYDVYSVRKLAARTRGWRSEHHRDLCPDCTYLRADALDPGYLDRRRDEYRTELAR